MGFGENAASSILLYVPDSILIWNNDKRIEFFNLQTQIQDPALVKQTLGIAAGNGHMECTDCSVEILDCDLWAGGVLRFTTGKHAIGQIPIVQQNKIPGG